MSTEKVIAVPDLGVSGDVTVIEINIKPGDTLTPEQTMLTLEGEKASMELPAPQAGIVEKILVKTGDKVRTGTPIVQLKSTEATATATPAPAIPAAAAPSASASTADAPQTVISPTGNIPAQSPASTSSTRAVEASTVTRDGEIYASPSVRRLARELDIDLHRITGTGNKNRIQKSDLLTYIQQRMQQGGSGALPAAPVVDFAKFGAIQTQPLNKIKKYTAQNLHRNWLLVPHVTQFDEADITELEIFRKNQQKQLEKQSIRLTPLVFLIKAVVAALKRFPPFNASLDAKGEQLILKQYFHIGVAVDTPDGLVVPVIRDADKKSLTELAQELAAISAKARAKQLTPADMQGSSFTISSLGGIGGTCFTPIVNLPDVAILGVSKSAVKPVWQEDKFVPRLMLPLSLSYDHRVIDGAEGARFMVQLCQYLTDIRLVLM